MAVRMLALPGLCVALAVALAPGAALAERVSLRVASARALPDEAGGAKLVVALTPQSAERLGKFTMDRVGLTIEVRVGGKVVATPAIRDPILGGSLEISQVGPLADAEALAEALAQGKATFAVGDKEKE